MNERFLIAPNDIIEFQYRVFTAVHVHLPDEPPGTGGLAAGQEQNVDPGPGDVFRSCSRPPFGNGGPKFGLPRANFGHQVPTGHLALGHG